MGKWNGRIFVVAALATGLTPLLPAASAAAYNHELKVYASVMPVRALYVNTDGDLVKVGGNTADNIEPRVFNPHNQTLPLSDSVNHQYEQLLKANGGHLIAGMIYTYNPVTVDTDSKPPALLLNTVGLTLGSG